MRHNVWDFWSIAEDKRIREHTLKTQDRFIVSSCTRQQWLVYQSNTTCVYLRGSRFDSRQQALSLSRFPSAPYVTGPSSPLRRPSLQDHISPAVLLCCYNLAVSAPILWFKPIVVDLIVNGWSTLVQHIHRMSYLLKIFAWIVSNGKKTLCFVCNCDSFFFFKQKTYHSKKSKGLNQGWLNSI